VTNSKWTISNQITRLNKKGLEIETKNALNIYSSALYGYNTSLPIAIANNAQSSEMIYEGFEDKSYNANLQMGASPNCTQKAVDFSSMSGARVINTTSTRFTAHTGKNVLEIGSGGRLGTTKVIPIFSSANDSFAFRFSNDTSKITQLIEPGGTFEHLTPIPKSSFLNEPYIHLSSIAGINANINPGFQQVGQNQPNLHNSKILASQFINVPEARTYSIFLGVTVSTGTAHPSVTCNLRLTICDLDGMPIQNGVINANLVDPQLPVNIYLCKGVYEVKYQIEDYQTAPAPVSGQDFTSSFKVTTSPIISSFKTLQQVSTECIHAGPIKYNDSMRNPSFTIPTAKKMVFSAWVREDCGSETQLCTKETYSGHAIELSFRDNNQQQVGGILTFKPTGPIIDGWQRYESYFTAPEGSRNGIFQFKNNLQDQKIYLDDIRIHPFSSSLTSYVYDPISLRQTAELDENNYAKFYEYDEEGTLARTKIETSQGIKTINETRSAKQKVIKQID
jgi:hypothetical protein